VGSYRDLGRLGSCERGRVGFGEKLALYAMPKLQEQKAEKEKSDHTTGSVSGRALSRICECASCKLLPDLVDDSIAFPSELELLHGLAGQRGSEAPQELSDCFLIAS
jgi:hypothetical protein